LNGDQTLPSAAEDGGRSNPMDRRFQKSYRKMDWKGTKWKQLEYTGGGLRPTVDDNRMIDDYDDVSNESYLRRSV